MTVLGLHHITLGCADAQRTIDFYTGVLGLRFVKRTVNFDDPGTYHLYFGDDLGRPGTAITFFEWPRVREGHPGIGGTHHFAMSVPTHSALLRWQRRLSDHGLHIQGPVSHEGLHEICFRDPDGVILKIVTEDASGDARQEWTAPDMALSQGLHHITAISSNLERTKAFYGDLLGMNLVQQGTSPDQPNVPEWVWAGQGGMGQIRTIQPDPQRGPRARIGVGQTHHFALAVPDDETQLEWRERLIAAGLSVSPVMDRMYFHSIYTRDPDGHIVELATNGPGFAADEDPAHLGEALKLPSWLETHRQQIATGLRPVTIPERGSL